VFWHLLCGHLVFAGFILDLKSDEWLNKLEQNKLKRAAQRQLLSSWSTFVKVSQKRIHKFNPQKISSNQTC